MTINIPYGYLIMGNLLIILIVYYLIHRFLRSDFFYRKTGHKIYYIKENGSRELIDSVTIFYFLSSTYFIFIFSSYLILLCSGSYYLYYYSLIACGLFTYSSILIYSRIKIFHYDDDKKESEKRCPFTYPIFSMRWTFLISFFAALLLCMYPIFHKPKILFSFGILIILLHIFIFPEYMNKVLPYDVRTLVGRDNWVVRIVGIIFTITFFITFSN